MSKEIFISYIVPCYNVEKYLPRCIESLRLQELSSTEFGIEFIMIDDGSTDGTYSLLDEFEKVESRALVIHQKNQGVSASRNNGLKIAHGQYVFFLDGDDCLTKDASQIFYDICKDCYADIVITNAYNAFESQSYALTEWNLNIGIEEGSYKTIDFVNKIVILPISFKAYKRDLLSENNIYFDENLYVGEVFAFFIHSLIHSNIILFSKKRVMCYTVRKGSVMRSFNTKRDLSYLASLSVLDQYANMGSLHLAEKKCFHLSLFESANSFLVFKYLFMNASYTAEIGNMINMLRSNEVYKRTLKFILCSLPRLNKTTVNAAILYYFPSHISYRILKIKMKSIMFLNNFKIGL